MPAPPTRQGMSCHLQLPGGSSPSATRTSLTAAPVLQLLLGCGSTAEVKLRFDVDIGDGTPKLERVDKVIGSP
jgi:hypothetical protein